MTIDKIHFVPLYSTTAFPTSALHNANINRFDGVWKVLDGDGPGGNTYFMMRKYMSKYLRNTLF